MTVAEKIIEHIKTLPESVQSEVLDFVEYLESKNKQVGRRREDVHWSEMSLTQAMRGLESEVSPYSAEDLKEAF